MIFCADSDSEVALVVWVVVDAGIGPGHRGQSPLGGSLKLFWNPLGMSIDSPACGASTDMPSSITTARQELEHRFESSKGKTFVLAFVDHERFL